MYRVAEDTPICDKIIMILQRGEQISLGAGPPGLECWPDYYVISTGMKSYVAMSSYLISVLHFPHL